MVLEALLPRVDTDQVAPIALAERKLDRAGVGKWLLAVVEGAGEPEAKLAKIQAFAYGLIAE